MKRAIVLLLAVVLVSAFLLTGCSGNSDNANPLVGTWSQDGLRDTMRVMLTFNANGTGELDVVSFFYLNADGTIERDGVNLNTLEFVWTVDSGTLSVDTNGVVEELEFSIDGDTLTTISSASGRETVYSRVE